jgi:hypothetical protein
MYKVLAIKELDTKIQLPFVRKIRGMVLPGAKGCAIKILQFFAMEQRFSVANGKIKEPEEEFNKKNLLN